MKFEWLLSQYLDGELAPQEREYLQRLLISDQHLWEQFLLALQLRWAMQGGSVTLPVEIDRRIRSVVREASLHRQKGQRRWLTTMLAFLLLLLFPFVLEEREMPQWQPAMMIFHQPEEIVQQSGQQGSDVGKGKPLPAVASETGFSLPVERCAVISGIRRVPLRFTLRSEVLNAAAVSCSERFAPVGERRATVLPVFLEVQPERQRVHFGLESATLLYHSHAPRKLQPVINGIAVALAYDLTPWDRVGLAIGYHYVHYQDPLALVLLQSPSPQLGGDGGPKTEGGGMILGQNAVPEVSPNGQPPSYVAVPRVLALRTQQYWGAVFYERLLFQRSVTATNMRVGIGGSTQGMLGIVQLRQTWHLASPLAVGVGLEYRILRFRLPYLNGGRTIWLSQISLLGSLRWTF